MGTELADFNEAFNVVFSIGDIRNDKLGNNNKSYTLNLPLTKTNKKLLKFINQADVTSEPSDTGRLYLGEMLVISGTVKVLDYNDNYAKIIIKSDTWLDNLKDKKMTALDLSTHDHEFNGTNIVTSWSASYPAYRYPMIYFGGLASGETGGSANWITSDFIPMISIVTLINKILEPYTIVSSWIAESFIKDLFILCNQKIADKDFIEEKDLLTYVDATTDNYDTATESGAFMVDIIKDLEFSNESTDEGEDWLTDTYTVPTTGTYRFRASVTMVNTGYGNGSVTITDEDFEIDINRNGTSKASFDAGAYGVDELIDGVTAELDTGYIYCEAGDSITIESYTRVIGTVTAGSQTITLYTAISSYFENVWGSANRYIGNGATISFEEMLPDMTQLDFLSVIKSIFNLKFWLDKSKQNLYIEPWDDFVSGTVVDLTDYVDNSDFPAELISKNYNETIIMRFSSDDKDQSFAEYLKENTDLPGQKEITLTSLFAEQDITYKTCEFATILKGYNYTINNYTTEAPTIWKELPVYPYGSIFDRLADFKTRIVEWKGLTAGFTWYFESATKSTYPKIDALDFSDIYNDYWIKHYHYVDKGKIYTVRIKLTPGFLNQFFTVVDTAASEGFRPTYSIEIDGIMNYFILQRVTTDGITAELEMVLKQ